MIFPQLALQAEITSLEAYINDDEWVIEQKLDGHRVLLMSPGYDMPPTALTRNGSIYSRKLPQAIQDFRFPEGEWVLDGELVDGTYYVFDLLIPTSDDNLAEPLYVRRAMLETFLDSIDHPFKIVPQARTPQEKVTLAETSLKENFEGLILKKKAAPYRSGNRTDEWLKVKYVVTADCVVLDVRDDGKESVRLGLYGPSGPMTRDIKLHEVGRASLIGKEKNGVISKGDVIEVKYLYAGAGGRLYQPTIMQKRDDKRPEECTTDQMKFVNKAVLETL